jgi:hypothetical protein
MSRPTALSITDLNGDKHECVAEAFDTTFNVLILLYQVASLTSSIVIMPAGFKGNLGLPSVDGT